MNKGPDMMWMLRSPSIYIDGTLFGPSWGSHADGGPADPVPTCIELLDRSSPLIPVSEIICGTTKRLFAIALILHAVTTARHGFNRYVWGCFNHGWVVITFAGTALRPSPLRI